VYSLDLARLPEGAELRREIESVPKTAWGSSFFAAHPKPWDFRHVLQVEDDDGTTKQVQFHRDQGPPELTRIVDKTKEFDPDPT
jgi:hypothetical protein